MREERARSALWRSEDYWAIWLAFAIIVATLVLFALGHASAMQKLAVQPKKWDSFSQLGKHFLEAWQQYVALLIIFLGAFSLSVRVMGLSLKQYVPGFAILYLLSACVLAASSWEGAHRYNIEAPLIALVVGLVAGNLLKLPRWMDTSLRTEYYIKTGIILLGATLAFTIILQAGHIALIQATIVSVTTFLAIYFAATRVLGLDRKFGAVMGAGGSVCGVSASIAVGGAVRARKEQIAISISLVVVWAVLMIFVLPILCRALGLEHCVSGAWIGTSEFADAAGYAAAASIGADQAVYTYTLVKVIGRDIWIGVWAFVLSIISILAWEKTEGSQRVSGWEIWNRFPKFVLGFFAASALVTLISMKYDAGGFNSVLKPAVIDPIKTLRTWTFTFTFLSIGLSTRFRELKALGWKPLLAFAMGVAVNLPLGYALSAIVFKGSWIAAVGDMGR